MALCLVCLDDETETLPVCTAGHRVCSACAIGLARHHAEAPSGRLECPAGPSGACNGRACPALTVIAVSSGGQDAVGAVGDFLAAQASVEAGAAELRGRYEGAKAAQEMLSTEQVDRAVRRIRDDILVERCPRCAAAFDDYDGCNALKCSQCGCGFCAVCLCDCGSDAHAHVASEHGELFDRQAADVSRLARRRLAVRQELERLSVAARERATALLAAELDDLGIAGASERTRECGPAQMQERAARCVAELERLQQHFSSGSATYEPVDQQTEIVTLVWKSHSQSHELFVHCDADDFADGPECRQRELEAQLRVHAFVKTVRDGRVYELTMMDQCNQLGFNVQPEGLARGRDLQIASYASFAREHRALEECRKLSDSPCNVLKVLLRGAPNDPALASSARLGFDYFHATGTDSLLMLNEHQRSALCEARVRTVQVVHGPPGTGKTSLIDQYIQSPACKGTWVKDARTRHVVIVLSEKNQAVDSIACTLLRRGGNTAGNPVWEETVCCGVDSALGVHTKRFAIINKVENDPTVMRAKRDCEEAYATVQAAKESLNDALDAHFLTIAAASDRAGCKVRDEKSRKELSLAEAYNTWKNDPEHLANIADEQLKLTIAPAIKQAKDAIASAHTVLTEAKAVKDSRELKLRSTKTQVEDRLSSSARVVLTTLGSAHGIKRVLVHARHTDTESDGKRAADDISATVICDEASTVQTALFVGAMGSLARDVKLTNLLVIGDNRQLPPYWPVQEPATMPGSLFDCASEVTQATFLSWQYRMPRFAMSVLNANFYSDTPLQYGKDGGSPEDGRPIWMHVPNVTMPIDRGGGRGNGRGFGNGGGRYGRGNGRGGGRNGDPIFRTETSPAETQAALAAVLRALERGQSVLVITPYRRQRSELERALNEEPVAKEAVKNGTAMVCTVDGSQGHEADVVVVSLVKARPSRFLDARRLCVMLSRMRQCLVLVGDRRSHLKCACTPLREMAHLAEEL